jgi:predicted NAD-dependent protein-ADP-ribosyltransferase YbiA (DUF1768 family)
MTSNHRESSFKVRPHRVCLFFSAVVLCALVFAGFCILSTTATAKSARLSKLAYGSALKQSSRDKRYPAHWWTPVSTEGKPEWEILPQEAGPGEVILSKRNELGLLSNFAPTPFIFRGQRYASLEGFWQMMLYPEGPGDPRARFPGLKWKYTRAQVAQLSSFEAKAAGTLAEENMKQAGISWASFKGKRFEYRSSAPGEHFKLIVAATREKVRQNPEVRRVLLATGDLILKPDHHPEPNAPPEWRYFELLTRIRSQLQNRER